MPSNPGIGLAQGQRLRPLLDTGQELGDAEIEDLDRFALRVVAADEEDVLGFQVAVDQLVKVGSLHGAAQAAEYPATRPTSSR